MQDRLTAPQLLPDGGILWASYDMNRGSRILDGTIHRSDDDGKSWRIVSIIRRRKPDATRPAPSELLGELSGADAIISGIGD